MRGHEPDLPGDGPTPVAQGRARFVDCRRHSLRRISFLIHWNPALNTGSFMTPGPRSELLFRDSRSGAVAMLIASRTRPPATSAERRLGIQFTGRAIGTSIVQLACAPRPNTVFLRRVVMMLANLVFLYIWWQALRAAPVRRQRALLFELLGPVRQPP